MPIDGVSFQNSGFQNVNPAEAFVQAEASSKAEAEKKIKEPDKSDETKSDSEENEDEDRDLQGRDTDDDEENDPDRLERILQNNKKFSVKFNSSTEMVEMIDTASGNIVETIAPEDLINILSNTKAFEGILVDRKI